MKWIFIISIVFISCKNKIASITINIPSVKIESTDTALHFANGIYFYHNNLFSGFITEKYANNIVHHITGYANGKEEGWQQSFFDDGKPEEKRFYHDGMKDSVHTGWWQNGNKRFEYHFANDTYNGDYKEWYVTGEPLKHIHYTNGVDDWGKGWRQNGKLYMNFVVKDGRRYGLNNSNLCYTIKNGNGEYVVSVPEKSSQ